MKKILLTLAIITIAAIPHLVMAQAQYTPLEPLPCIPGGGVECPTTNTGKIDFKQYIQQMFNFVIFIAAAAAVFMIVFGGFQYMTTDSWQGKREGLDKARKALLGLLLVLSSFLLLRTIDPRLVEIPNTLVKPLNLESQKIDLTAVDGLAIAYDEEYRDNLADIRQNIADGQTRVTNLQTQKSALESKICGGGNYCTSAEAASEFCQSVPVDDPTYGADCNALNQINNEIESVTRDTVEFNRAKGQMLAIVQQCSVSTKPECADENELRQRIATIYNQYSPEISPDKSQELAAYGLYSQAAINIKQQLAIVESVATLNQLSGTALEIVKKFGINYNSSILQNDPAWIKLRAQKTLSIDSINQAVTRYEASAMHDQNLLIELKNQAATAIQVINETVPHS